MCSFTSHSRCLLLLGSELNPNLDPDPQRIRELSESGIRERESCVERNRGLNSVF